MCLRNCQIKTACHRADSAMQCDEATPRCGQCSRSHRFCTYFSESNTRGAGSHSSAADLVSQPPRTSLVNEATEKSRQSSMRLISERTTASGATFQRFSTAATSVSLRKSIVSSSSTLQSTWTGMLRYTPAAVFSAFLPSRLGQEQVLDTAAQYYCDTHAAFLAGTPSSRIISHRSGNRAYKTLRLSLQESVGHASESVLLAACLVLLTAVG